MLTSLGNYGLKVKVTACLLAIFAQAIIVPGQLENFVSRDEAVQVEASVLVDPFLNENLMIPDGKSSMIYTSSVKDVNAFYAAQISWGGTFTNTEESKSVVFFIKTDDADWQEVAEDIDAEPGISLPVFTEMSKTIQVMVLLKEIDGKRPRINNVEVQLLNPGITSESFPLAMADEQIVTRKSWGADESLRLRETRDRIRTENAAKEAAKKPTPSTPKPEEPKKESTATKQPTEAEEYGPNCENLEAKYPDEFKVTKVISKNPDGKPYTWPIAISTKLRKLVVHHTDIDVKDYDQNGVIDEKDYRAAVNSIYYFHTISRDWGDIGYNYLIDPEGRIYEGRAGGDLAVAAHTLCKNNGSLGVALLGNFQNAVPTAQALKALQSLVNAKAKEYNIDPRGSSMFYGSYLPNVIGHRNVRKTSCPGDRLYELLPSLRDGNLADTTKLVFPKSEEKMTFDKSVPANKSSPIKETEKLYKSEVVAQPGTVQVHAGDLVTLNLKFKNTGNTVWNSNTIVKPLNLESGLTMVKEARQNQTLVSPGDTATFLPQLAVSDVISTKKATLEFYVVANDLMSLSSYKAKITLDIVPALKGNNDVSLNTMNAFASQVKRSAESFTKFITEEVGGPPPSEIAKNKDENKEKKEIRIKLSVNEPNAIAEVNQSYNLIIDNKKISTLDKTIRLNVISEQSGLLIKAGKNVYRGLVVKVEPIDENGLITLVNFHHAPEWNKNLNDNIYRGSIEWRVLNSQLVTINELPVEDYLKGLAEVSDSAPFEKQKTMAIIARSYALYYVTRDYKFPGMPYDLDDDPSKSQKYLGYGYEKRSPRFVQAVGATDGLVVSYENVLVKTPYFNQSDGRTRSAEEVWGWTNTPYLVSVPDPLCNTPEKKLLGHGVGLSGCGAEAAAKRGYSAVDILSYYYPGTKVVKFNQLLGQEL